METPLSQRHLQSLRLSNLTIVCIIIIIIVWSYLFCGNLKIWFRRGGKIIPPPPVKCLKGSYPPCLPDCTYGSNWWWSFRTTQKPKTFLKRGLTKKRNNFNYRFSRALRYIECAFRILTNKWRVLHRAILIEPVFADYVIKACCILHNYVRRRNGYNFEGQPLKLLRKHSKWKQVWNSLTRHTRWRVNRDTAFDFKWCSRNKVFFIYTVNHLSLNKIQYPTTNLTLVTKIKGWWRTWAVWRYST